MREDAGADAGAERSAATNMPHCIISWARPSAAQERRLAALVGAGDHHQRLAVGIDVVSDDALVEMERQTDVVDALAR